MDVLGLAKKRTRIEPEPSTIFNEEEVSQEVDTTFVAGFEDDDSDIPSLKEAGFIEENGKPVKVRDPFKLAPSERKAKPERTKKPEVKPLPAPVQEEVEDDDEDEDLFKRFGDGLNFDDTPTPPPVEKKHFLTEYEERDFKPYVPPIEIEPEPVPEPEPIVQQEPLDPIEEKKEPAPFIARLTPDHYELSRDSYQTAFSVSAEALAINVLESNQVTNMSLSAFGEFGKMYQPQVLTVIEFGVHKFIGRHLSSIEKMRLFYQIEKFFLEGTQDTMVLKLTQAITFQNVKYITLLATPEELTEYSAMFFQEVSINPNEPDETNLVAVIRRCR